MAGSVWAQQIATNFHRQRARAGPNHHGEASDARVNSVLVALPLPRHRESAAADLAASHTGLIIPVLAIEGVRAHTSVVSTGALAVFRACRRALAPLDRSPPRLPLLATLQHAPFGCMLLIFKYCQFARAAGFLPALGSVV